MAVVVQCFHCNAILELDEAFRGGVCRCSACGSLLQVPKGEAVSVGKKVRPAGPPAPSAGVLRNAGGPGAAVGGDAGGGSGAVGGSGAGVGISSGAFDPKGGEGMDRCGLSSGLAGAAGGGAGRARIHQTRPISATSVRKKGATVPEESAKVPAGAAAGESGRLGAPEAGAAEVVAAAVPGTVGAPGVTGREVAENGRLLWVAVSLIVLIAAVVMGWLVMVVWRGGEM